MSFSTWLDDQIAAAKSARNNTNPTLPAAFKANIQTEMETLALSMVFVPVPTGQDRTDTLTGFDTLVKPYISDFQLDIFRIAINAKIDVELSIDRDPALDAPAPTYTSVSPTSANTAGGTSLTINGTGFQSSPTVTVGGAAATTIVRMSAYKITCVAPAHAAGAVAIVVTNPDGQSVTAAAAVTYA